MTDDVSILSCTVGKLLPTKASTQRLVDKRIAEIQNRRMVSEAFSLVNGVNAVSSCSLFRNLLSHGSSSRRNDFVVHLT